jgi:hypothetical protein
MFKHIITYSYLILSVVLFTSCDDFLDQNPKGDIEEDQLYDKENSFQDLLNGCYSKLKNENFIGGLTSMALPDIMADDLLYSANNNGNQINFYKWTYNSSTAEVENIWLAGYQIVQSCNEIIENQDKISERIDTEKRNSILAQAYAIRALSYYHLHRFFADTKSNLSIPYKTKLKLDEPKRNTKDEVLEYCMQDLNKSLELGIISRENIYLSNSCAYFLKMLIELERKNYSEVIKNADTILASNSNLSDKENFKKIWTGDNGIEILFRIHFTEEDKPKNAWLLYDTRNKKNTWLVNKSLIDLYEDNDVRLTSYFEKLSDGTYGVKKYRGRSGADMPNGNDVKLMRLAEVYLSKAEALAQNEANKADVIHILNLIRKNRGGNPLTDVEDTLMEVKKERQREFFAEGKRFFDLKRWGENINRPQSEDSKLLSTGDYRWALPIPIAEIYANENIKQNSNY